MIWESGGQRMVFGLPRIDPQMVGRVVSQYQLDADATLKGYAEATGTLNYKTLDASDHFARHFYGTLIRKSDASPWGVLLLDSFDESCPFIVEGKPSEAFVQRFNDFARIIGKIVS